MSSSLGLNSSVIEQNFSMTIYGSLCLPYLEFKWLDDCQGMLDFALNRAFSLSYFVGGK